MATTDFQSLWQSVFPDRSRPVLLADDVYNEDGFLPLANPKDFAVDIPTLSSQQLFVIASNNQIALKQAQDEFMELERQINIVRNPDPTSRPPIKNPQAFPDHQEFEERKEALLYNYKYDPKKYPEHKKTSDVSEQEKRDSRFEQDPFSQGGFVPNERQYRAARSKAKDSQNPDGWTPIEKKCRSFIPRMYHEPPKDQKETMTRSKTASLVESGGRAGTDDIDDYSGRGTPVPVNKMLRNTRFNGTKVPMTRDVSEDPAYPPSRASTPKRKRGDTPLPSIEFGSPLKKMRATSETEPPKRKRHNQYTKARELREKAEAEAAAKTAKESFRHGFTTRTNQSADAHDYYVESRGSTADLPNTQTPLRRKRHNQYTKAKERAEMIAAEEEMKRVTNPRDVPRSPGTIPTISFTSDDVEVKRENDLLPMSLPQNDQAHILSPSPMPLQPTEHISRLKFTNRLPVWATMTPADKLHHKWDSESLIAAIKDDYTWLPEDTDAQKRAERDRLLGQKNPHRSFSIKNKWRFWKKEGLDKRPRKNKPLSGFDGVLTGDEAMSTPGPMSEQDVDTDMDNDDFHSVINSSQAPKMEVLKEESFTSNGYENHMADDGDLDDGV